MTGKRTTTTPFPPHPASQLLPPLEGRAYEALRDDLRINGQLEAVVVHEGKNLDGNNRQRALLELGTPVWYSEWAGEAGTPEAFVLSKNVTRRHLKTSQRAMLAAIAMPGLEVAAKERLVQGARNSREGVANLPDPRNARDDAAKLFCVSPRMVQDAKKVMTSARGDLIDSILRGDLSLTAAVRKLAPPVEVPSNERLHEPHPAAAPQTPQPHAPIPPSQYVLPKPGEEELCQLPEARLSAAAGTLLALITGPHFKDREALRPDIRGIVEEAFLLVTTLHGLARRAELIARDRARYTPLNTPRNQA